MPAEFNIIDTYFKDKSPQKNKHTRLGMGDDGAIVSIASGYDMVIVVDTLVAGVHFPKQTAAYDIGYKALAVNLSDLAAMGAEPTSFTLALTLSASEQNKNWLKKFSEGVFELANQANIELIGGDTTQGPLSITIQAHGLIPKNQALLRSGAQAGDWVFVTGTLGDALVGLQSVQKSLSDLLPLLSPEEKKYCENRLNRPQPKLTAGLLLRDIATSCIDVSDGLVADLGHICEASQCRAAIYAQSLPLSPAYKKYYSATAEGPSIAATGGDDYELCFTVNPNDVPKLQALPLGCSITHVGEIFSTHKRFHSETEADTSSADTPRSKVVLLNEAGTIIPVTQSGYSHFSA